MLQFDMKYCGFKEKHHVYMLLTIEYQSIHHYVTICTYPMHFSFAHDM